MEKHSVSIENREKITITDVRSVDTFDEEEVCIELTEGGLELKGKNLHMHMLDPEEGTAVITGEITTVSYVKKKAGRNLVQRLFK